MINNSNYFSGRPYPDNISIINKRLFKTEGPVTAALSFMLRHMYSMYLELLLNTFINFPELATSVKHPVGSWAILVIYLMQRYRHK